jgi:uncharacterized membrane protein HdeD (DUF308 family)
MQPSKQHSSYDYGSSALTAHENAVRINAAALAERWGAVALRGAAAVLFGVLTLFWPGISLYALVILFGGYAVVDGVSHLVMAGRGARRGRPWGSLAIAGSVGVLAGVITFVWPRITALALVLLIAVWAIVTGIAEIVAAIRLRKEIRGEWLLGLSGILSVAFGVLLFLFPGAGALTVVIWIGAYALVFGALTIGLAFRLRSWGRAPEHRWPTGGIPSAAS